MLWFGCGLLAWRTVQIRVLGPVEIAGADPPDGGLERKARQLLTLLALRAPAVIGVDELSELLWDDPPPTAARIIQAHLSRLRTAIASAGTETVAIERTGDGYRLQAPHVTVDVTVVADLREQARRLRTESRHDEAANILQTARSEWRGPVELPGTVAALAVAARWEQERRNLDLDHLAAVVDGSHASDAVPELEVVTALDPLDERAWELLVLALHRSGRKSAALRAYQAGRRALAEVGLDPGTRLREAEAVVLAHSADKSDGTTHAVDAGDDVRIRYASAGEGNVAYTTLGDGERDVVVLNPGLVSIDGIGSEHHLAAGMGRLAKSARVIALDRRGIGLSDPVASHELDVGAWVDDVLAVLDATDSDRPLVLANSDTGLVALALAATQPDRVGALVLVHGYARYTRSRDYPYGVDPDTALATSAEVLALEPRTGRFDPLSHIAPSVASDAAFRRWWDSMGRRSAGPGAAAALHAVVQAADVRSVLAQVAAPVLLLHRRSCASCDVGHARFLADNLPQAQLVLLDGADELWFVGDVEAVLDEVDTFSADF